MKYYRIKPDVAGGVAEGTIVDRISYPPIISNLHFQFADWFGDDIVTGFPVFLVTQKLANLLNINYLKGFEIANCTISTYEIFDDLHPEGLELPPFFWLKIHGTPPDDFFLLDGKRLCVSQKALEILQTCNLHYADIEEITI